MSIPAHKSGTAGQTVNNEELDNMSYKSRPRTLGDVIDNVLVSEQRLIEGKRKLTFEEWLSQAYGELGPVYVPKETLRRVWRAAQENAPSQAPGARIQREYSQSEIDSWNAQGGSFTSDEIKRSQEWK